jgi:hypothetical protein
LVFASAFTEHLWSNPPNAFGSPTSASSMMSPLAANVWTHCLSSFRLWFHLFHWHVRTLPFLPMLTTLIPRLLVTLRLLDGDAALTWARSRLRRIPMPSKTSCTLAHSLLPTVRFFRTMDLWTLPAPRPWFTLKTSVLLSTALDLLQVPHCPVLMLPLVFIRQPHPQALPFQHLHQRFSSASSLDCLHTWCFNNIPPARDMSIIIIPFVQ